MNFEILMHQVAQLKADIAELRAKHDVLVAQCERLVDENEQLIVHKEHLTEEIDRIETRVLTEQVLQQYAAIIESSDDAIIGETVIPPNAFSKQAVVK